MKKILFVAIVILFSSCIAPARMEYGYYEPRYSTIIVQPLYTPVYGYSRGRVIIPFRHRH